PSRVSSTSPSRRTVEVSSSPTTGTHTTHESTLRCELATELEVVVITSSFPGVAAPLEVPPLTARRTGARLCTCASGVGDARRLPRAPSAHGRHTKREVSFTHRLDTIGDLVNTKSDFRSTTRR